MSATHPHGIEVACRGQQVTVLLGDLTTIPLPIFERLYAVGDVIWVKVLDRIDDFGRYVGSVNEVDVAVDPTSDSRDG